MKTAEFSVDDYTIRLSLDIRHGVIAHAGIEGNFVISPPTAQADIENLLTGRSTAIGISDDLLVFINDNNVQLAGIMPQHIEQLCAQLLGEQE